MKVFSLVAASLAVTATAFDIKPTGNARRDFLSKTVATAGVAFLGGSAAANAAVPFADECDKEPSEFASIAACFGDSKEMTPSEQAYADYLMTKMKIPQDNQPVKSKETTLRFGGEKLRNKEHVL
ncbi:expressed unknown protein [Seminavis robusta]|uniref:Uncharacterized protein n=1 Tax=Seminavis robusta TaxID=568900 RepID=A0A9N8F089_9STRA|nr:expressed unknown protein [Seminavis robusta]|eukprot:Sro2553_g331050.1 n/a (125) ;mRNA; f:8324-8698